MSALALTAAAFIILFLLWRALHKVFDLIERALWRATQASAEEGAQQVKGKVT